MRITTANPSAATLSITLPFGAKVIYGVIWSFAQTPGTISISFDGTSFMGYAAGQSALTGFVDFGRIAIPTDATTVLITSSGTVSGNAGVTWSK